MTMKNMVILRTICCNLVTELRLNLLSVVCGPEFSFEMTV